MYVEEFVERLAMSPLRSTDKEAILMGERVFEAASQIESDVGEIGSITWEFLCEKFDAIFDLFITEGKSSEKSLEYSWMTITGVAFLRMGRHVATKVSELEESEYQLARKEAGVIRRWMALERKSRNKTTLRHDGKPERDR